MEKKIDTAAVLSDLVNRDQSDHQVRQMATLLLDAMNDWPTQDQYSIETFVKELKSYFGTPLTMENISGRRFDGGNAWQLESGSSIAKLIQLSIDFSNERDFDVILRNILDFYHN